MQAENGAKLRFEFISMVFALAIAQVGIEIGDFFGKGLFLSNYLYVVSHLALSVYIISSSWIGWQKSTARGNSEKVVDTFSISYLILLIDLFLVIFYFILVKGVEKMDENGQIEPDSTVEVFWSLVIFTTYFLWDIVTKLINITDHKNLKIKIECRKFINRAYQALISFLIVFFLIRPLALNTSGINVILVDLALIFVFALFRGLKLIHNIDSTSRLRAMSLRVLAYIIIPVSGLFVTLYLNYYYYV